MRKTYFSELVRYVRLPLCDINLLARLRSDMPFIKNNKLVCDLFDEAILYHLLPSKRLEYKKSSKKMRSCVNKNGLIVIIGEKWVESAG